MTDTHLPAASELSLEERITQVGRALGETLSEVLDRVPDSPRGPQDLARTLGLDKVLTSRLLKAVRRGRDPMAVVYHLPGPEPLRRFVTAARKRGAAVDRCEPALAAIDQFENLIRRDVGDRSALDALITSWLPEARREFELRRKQSAFKAMSQLKGVAADTNLATVILHPSPDGEHIDIVWIIGLLGLRRLRPGARVRFATRRIASENKPRQPTALDGGSTDGLLAQRLDEFCTAPPAPIEAHRSGEVVHYTLAGDDYGPRSAVDLLLAEVNLAEIPRYVPAELGRKGYVFAEIGTPSSSLLFDVFLHEDVYPGSTPALEIYDTAFDGVVDVNDPARQIDRLELAESIEPLGQGIGTFRAQEIPNYLELVRHVVDRMGWDGDRFRGHRCRIDYPIYGTQIAATFDPPSAP